MNILKIIHGYPPDYNAGSEVYSQSICNELSKIHTVTIFTREENPFYPDFSLRKLNLNTRLSKYLINLPREKDGYRQLSLDQHFGKILDEVKPDLAHIGHLNHLSTGLVDQLYQRHIPIIFTLHDFWLMCPRGQFLQRNFGATTFHQLCDAQADQKCAKACYNAYFSGLPNTYERDLHYWTNWIHARMRETRNLTKKVDMFIAPSNYLRTRFITDFDIPPEKIIYLDYGFPLEYLSTPPAQPKADFSFGYIGTHIPAKGIHLLIEAFEQLEGRASLKIWGRQNGVYTKFLKAMAEKVQTKDKAILWMGEYSNQEIAKAVFSQVDSIVVPSIWGENSPLVIHEAQACGVPIITANYGGMKEYVRHHVNGLLFEHRNSDDLKAQMQYALTHPDQIKTFAKRGYLYSEDGQVMSIQQHCQRLVEIYQQLLISNF